MKKIDLDTWPRRTLYEYFRNLGSPHFSVTAEVDVTRLIERAKPAGVRVFNYSLYGVMRASNSVTELRQRLTPDGVVEFDAVHPAPTVPIDGDRFAFCYFDYSPDWETFNERCEKEVSATKQQTELKDESSTRDDLIFSTCLPWLAFTAVNHPVAGPDDSFPRVAWGKFVQRGDNWVMPVNVHAHHALVDGLHIGKFFQVLQETMDQAG